MLLILLSILLCIPFLLGVGKLVEKFFGNLFKGVSSKILLGMQGTGLIWSLFSSFTPMNTKIEIPTLLLGHFSFIYFKLYKDLIKLVKQNILLLTIAVILVAVSGSIYPYILDKLGYYAPTVEWLQKLGLLDESKKIHSSVDILGINKIDFNKNFLNTFYNKINFNAVLLIVYVIYIIEKKSWIQLCFLPLFLFFTQSDDFILAVIIFSVIILNELLSKNKSTSLIFAFSAFIFILKPTMVLIPILCAVYAIFIVRSGFKSLIFGGIIIGLFYFRHLEILGYPIFPQ